MDEVAITENAMEEYISNLILIYNHIFAYGCKELHHWSIISNMEHESIKFVNITLPKADDEEKGLSWLVLALSEPNLLSEIINKICNDGSLLDSYEDASLMLTHKESLITVSNSISTNKMKVEGDLQDKYLKWLNRKAANEIAIEIIELTLNATWKEVTRDNPYIKEKKEIEPEDHRSDEAVSDSASDCSVDFDMISQYSRSSLVSAGKMPVSPELQLLRHLVQKTLTFPKMIEYYKDKKIDLV